MLKVGQKVKYTGDNANVEGEGKIIEIVDGSFGQLVTVKLTDGREFVISPVSFHKSPGRRFIPWDEYQADRAAKIAQLEAMYSKTAPRKQGRPKVAEEVRKSVACSGRMTKEHKRMIRDQYGSFQKFLDAALKKLESAEFLCPDL